MYLKCTILIELANNNLIGEGKGDSSTATLVSLELML